MVKSKKAQFAMEYIMVIAILFVLLIPSIYLYYSYSQKSLEQISHSKVSDIGNAIINNVENTYYLGKGSKITLNINMPNGLTDITIMCNKDPPEIPDYCELTFYLEGTEVSFSTQVPIKKKDSVDLYPHTFNEEQYSQGVKKVIIETWDYVEIDIQ